MWGWLWTVWAAAFFLSFLAIEIPAYSRHETLSETVWRLLGLGHDLTPRYRFFRIGLALGLGWLLIHLLSGGYW